MKVITATILVRENFKKISKNANLIEIKYPSPVILQSVKNLLRHSNNKSCVNSINKLYRQNHCI